MSPLPLPSPSPAPRAGRQPPHVVALARLLFKEGLTTVAISTQLAIPVRTIRRWRENLEIYGDVYPPRIAVLGRPRVLTPQQAQSTLDYLSDQPTRYLDEVALEVWDEFGVEVSTTTV